MVPRILAEHLAKTATVTAMAGAAVGPHILRGWTDRRTGKKYPGMVGWGGTPEEFWAEAEKRKIHPGGASGVVDPLLQMRQDAGQYGMDAFQAGQSLQTFVNPQTNEFMWEKYAPFAQQMGRLAAQPAGWSAEQQQMAGQLPQWQAAMQRIAPAAGGMGQLIERGFTQEGDRWQFNPQKMWESTFADVQALRDAGFQSPQQFGQWAGEMQGFMKQYGTALPEGMSDPQSLINQFKTGDGGLDPERLRGFRELTDFFRGTSEAKGYTREIQEAGLDPAGVLGMAGRWGIGSDSYKIEGSDLYDFARIKEDMSTSVHALDVLEDLKEEGLDLGALMQFEGSGDMTSILEALGEEDQNAMDVVKERYGGLGEMGERGTKAKERFRRDMRGAIAVAPMVKQVRAGFDDVFGDLPEDQRAGLGINSPGSMIRSYVQKNGDIDFDSLQGELGFWNKALDVVKGDEKLKGKFINTLGLMRRINGIGFLKNAKSLPINNFHQLFVDKKTGKIRTNAFKVALTVGSWAEGLFKRLIDEPDPMAWLGVLGAGVGALGLLKGLFGGPQPGMMPGTMGAAAAPGAAPAATSMAGTHLQFPSPGEHRTPTEWLRMLGGEPTTVNYL